MNKHIYHIALFIFSLAAFFAKGQERTEFRKEIKPDSIVVIQKTDSLSQKVNSRSPRISAGIDSSYNELTRPLDPNSAKITKLKQALQHRIDSLKSKGNPSLGLQQKLDSLSNKTTLPSEKYNEFLALDQKVKDHITTKVPGLDALSSIENNVKEKVNDIQAVSTELGIGPLGKDLKPNIDTSIPSTGVPGLPTDINTGINISDANKPNAVNPQLATEKIPGQDLNNPAGQLPGEVGDLRNKAGKLSEVAQQAGDLTKNADEYGKEIKTIKEEGLSKSEKLPELAEQQALQIEEVKVLKAQEAMSTQQMEEYKKLIEQYKDEKKIHEELKEKARDQATEIMTQNQGKVDIVMKKISKYNRKFPQVQDMRNLPKRAPNPMKEVRWRERLVPGFTFQTLTNTTTWLELDPQVYYKLNGSWSAGIGGMYRFSMNPGKLTFDDFGSMSGGKVFVQYHAFKGFFLRGEGQFVSWKPWDLKLTDPDFVDKTYVAAAGIGKSFNITKKLKGNAQTLYHFHWEGMDPYKSKIMIRIGLDFSLKKREVKHWEKKLKELNKKQKSKDS